MSKFFGGGSLVFKYRSDLIFLHPNEPSEIQFDAVFEGSVVLQLPSPRKVKRLDVELFGRQNMYLLGKYEQYDTLHRKLTIDIFDKYGELSAGKHEFAWSFVIPANTAPYERLKIARTYHKLVATAYGCGKFGSDLILTEPDIGIVNNSNELGQAPSGYSESTETHHPTLGPLRVSLFTRYFLISGFLRLSVRMPAIAADVRIDGIKVILTQNVKLHSMQNPERGSEELAPLNVILYDSVKDADKEGGNTNMQAGMQLKENGDFSLVKKMRVADDEIVRPSTNEWSITGIKVSHQLSVVITFTAKEEGREREETKEMKIKWDAKLSSCDCMLENLQVPSYSRDNSPCISPSPTRPPSPGQPTRHNSWTQQPTSSSTSSSAVQGLSRHGYVMGARKGAIHKSQCLCQLATRESMELSYGVNLEEVLGQEEYGAARCRGRTGRWKDDEEFGNDLIGELVRR